MKRFLALFAVVAVLISCFLPCVYADNTVATSTDIYLNAFCNNNSNGTVAAPCPVAGGFPLGFKRSASVSDQVPSITYWNYSGKMKYYRVDLGTLGTGVTNIAFNFRILDELSGAYNNDVASSGHSLVIYSDSGTVPVSDLEWFVNDAMTFTGQSYSTVTFSLKAQPSSTAENAYLVFGLYYNAASIPAIVEIPQYKWSGPVNGFGSTLYDDIDAYPNADQYYIPVNEAVYMQACFDAYSAASYFSYFGQGMMSQTLDLDIILDQIQMESRVLQAQNEALASRIITQVNNNVDQAEQAINTNIDEAEESLNANIDEESQAIQGAIGDQTSDLETYFQPIIDHYNEVDQVGEELGGSTSGNEVDQASSDVSGALNAVPDNESLTSVLIGLSGEFEDYFQFLFSNIPKLISFGVNVPVFNITFSFIVTFLFIFFILKVLRGD